MIRLTGIRRDFQVGDQVVSALRGVDLMVEAGEHVAIMGPSGSGKSTMLNVLGCLDRPTAGSYELGGRDVSRLSGSELSRVRGREIGFVFQSFHLVPRLTAEGNVDLPMAFAGLAPKERKRRIAAALEQVGLSHRADHRPRQMSGGERQRVAIARAVVMQPKILLADEPTGNLDSKSGAEIVALLERLNREGLTLIVVTHDDDLGRRCRRLVRLADGAIVSDEMNEEARAG
ncbi:MAG: ABC transporter ATP-binding protein [Acidobacteriota bacterium]